MANKDRMIVKNAKVTHVLPDTKYRVELENGFQVLCYPSGKVKKSYFKINRNDQVKVEIPLNDPTRGRIVHRYRSKLS